MGFLEDFYKEATKNNKIKSNADLNLASRTQAGLVKDPNRDKMDFYGTFASTFDPKFGDQLQAAYDVKKKRLDRIKAFEAAAAQADKAAADNTNRTAAGNIVKYGPNAAKNAVVDTSKSIAQSITQPVVDVVNNARSIPQGASDKNFNADQIISAQKKAQSLPNDIKESAKGLNPSQQIQLLKLVDAGVKPDKLRNYLKTAKVEKNQQDVKTAGTALSTASMAVGGEGATKAFAEGGIRAAANDVALTAASGALGNTGNTLTQNPGATKEELLKSAALGAGFGATTGIVSAGAGTLLKNLKNKSPSAEMLSRVPRSDAKPFSGTVDDITKSKIDSVIQQAAATPRPEGTVRVFQATGKGTTSNWVTDNIDRLQAFKNNNTGVSDNFTFMDVPTDALKPTRNGSDIFKLKTAAADVNKPSISSRISTAVDNTVPDANNPNLTAGSVPMAAQRTEALAVEKKLAQGFDLKATPNISLADQADKAVNILNADYEKAKAIAMGDVNPPNGVLPSTVFEAVKARAAREGDAETLRKLATESKIPGVGKSYGQYNAAFAYKDPESPFTAMESIVQARKKAGNPNLPADLTPEESTAITNMARDVAAKKAAIQNGANRFEYGNARVAYDNYVNTLKQEAEKKSLKDYSARELAGKGITETASLAKSLKASLDVSRLLRQDWKTVFSHPLIWAKNSAKSLKDAVDQFGGKEVADAVKADIVSRPNADLYQSMEKAAGVNLFPINEEAFPSTLPERVPGFGRIYKASEAAFTAGQWRERADLADLYINIAKQTGVDLTDKKELASLGEFIGNLTSRGKVKNQGRADLYNKLFFAPRNLKANLRFLTAEQGHGATSFVKQEAAKNLLKTIAGTAVILSTANALKPGSVDFDPRSSNFGKIKIGNTRFDVSGGMASMITLASRLVPTVHNGKTGFWYKSSSTGQWTDLQGKNFGQQDVMDVLTNFAEGKASPGAATLIDLWKGETFTGDKLTPGGELKNAFLPLPIATYQELQKDPKSANKLVSMLADGLGVGTNTYSTQKDWNKVDTKKITGFKSSVSQDTFMKANQDYNDTFDSWYQRVQKNPKFTSLPDDTQQKLISAKKTDLTDEILKKYGYEYKTQKSNVKLKDFK